MLQDISTLNTINRITVNFLLLFFLFVFVSCDDNDEPASDGGTAKGPSLPYDPENCRTLVSPEWNGNCSPGKTYTTPNCQHGWIWIDGGRGINGSYVCLGLGSEPSHARCCFARASAIVQAIEYASFEYFQNCQAAYSKEHNEIQFANCK